MKHKLGTDRCFMCDPDRDERDHKPFTVTPEIGTLAVNDSMQVTIEFNPTQTGDHHGNLITGYDTGKTLLRIVGIPIHTVTK